MKEYDLYVPLLVAGKRWPAARLDELKKRLIKKFGGLTYFPQKNKGFWRIGRATFQDELVILRILSESNSKSFWLGLKKELQRDLQQKDILIVARTVEVLH
jgi:hypothetical protein